MRFVARSRQSRTRLESEDQSTSMFAEGRRKVYEVLSLHGHYSAYSQLRRPSLYHQLSPLISCQMRTYRSLYFKRPPLIRRSVLCTKELHNRLWRIQGGEGRLARGVLGLERIWASHVIRLVLDRVSS